MRNHSGVRNFVETLDPPVDQLHRLLPDRGVYRPSLGRLRLKRQGCGQAMGMQGPRVHSPTVSSPAAIVFEAMMHDGGMMMDGFWVWGLLVSILVIALIVLAGAATLWLLRGGRGSGNQAGNQAREILDLRYARGELSTEEYAQRRRDIQS